MSNPQDLIDSRVASYLKSAWYARWGVLAIVSATFWFVPSVNRPVIGGLFVATVVYNLLLLLGSRRRIGWLTDRVFILVIDGVLALSLVIFTGASTSPYLLTLAFMIISGAYWYGSLVGIYIGAVQTLVMYIQFWEQDRTAAFPTNLFVRMMILITIGIYVSLLTRSDRMDRQTLLTLGTQTEEEKQRLLALIGNMSDAAIVLDNRGKVVIYNQPAMIMAGPKRMATGRPLHEVLRFENAEAQPVSLEIKPAARAFERNDLRLRAPDNSLVSVAVKVAPYMADHQVQGHILVLRDVSQDKTLAKEREEFIAVASHELRTPLTIAEGDISLLLTPSYLPQNPESVDMLNGALRSLRQLSNIIKDFTNLSRVESEQLEVELEPLNPIALLEEFQSDYEDQAKAKGLTITTKVDPDLNSATILTSRYVVREILAIFVTNAIKFTNEGTVTLAVMNPEDGSPGVTFAVNDTGIGISQSDQKKIFEKFFQSETYTTRIHGGTGLGLYIAKQLAARLTARIWFKSQLGKGSTFYLWVPPYSKHKQDSGKVAVAETKDFFDTL